MSPPLARQHTMQRSTDCLNRASRALTESRFIFNDDDGACCFPCSLIRKCNISASNSLSPASAAPAAANKSKHQTLLAAEVTFLHAASSRGDYIGSSLSIEFHNDLRCHGNRAPAAAAAAAAPAKAVPVDRYYYIWSLFGLSVGRLVRSTITVRWSVACSEHLFCRAVRHLIFCT